jgi:hypothetical protein
MRGRFHPRDGQLYVCGMYSWAGSREQPGGLYRVRYTGRPAHLPIGLAAHRGGMAITFTDKLDAASVGLVQNYGVKTWSLRRTANYGSDHYDEKQLEVTGATLSEDGKTVFLEIPQIHPTWCMEISYSLSGATGEAVRGLIHNTVHRLRDSGSGVHLDR